MNRNVKRFISIILSVVLCVSMSMVTMAAEVEFENNAAEMSAVFEDTLSPYATTVGDCVFSLNNYGNASGTALKSQGSQRVDFDRGPKSLTYLVLPKTGSGSVYIKFKNNNSSVELTADGKTHTVDITGNGLQYTTSVEIEYYGASTPLVSISLVFAR